jgi:Cdc6-like AAA superfamily ATPase
MGESLTVAQRILQLQNDVEEIKTWIHEIKIMKKFQKYTDSMFFTLVIQQEDFETLVRKKEQAIQHLEELTKNKSQTLINYTQHGTD